jgi:hypothetical protein
MESNDWPKITDAGLVDKNGELYNEEKHAAWPAGEKHPPMTSAFAWQRKRGRKAGGQGQDVDPGKSQVSDAEALALATIAAAVDVETCDEAEYDIRDEELAIRERVHDAAEKRRAEFRGD